jgi:hypothetical protein
VPCCFCEPARVEQHVCPVPCCFCEPALEIKRSMVV